MYRNRKLPIHFQKPEILLRRKNRDWNRHANIGNTQCHCNRDDIILLSITIITFLPRSRLKLISNTPSVFGQKLFWTPLYTIYIKCGCGYYIWGVMCRHHINSVNKMCLVYSWQWFTNVVLFKRCANVTVDETFCRIIIIFFSGKTICHGWEINNKIITWDGDF